MTALALLKQPRPTAMTDKFLNSIDLSRRWRVSPRTLERKRWTGDGPPYVKIGGAVRYRLDDIEAYEAEQRRVPRQTSSGSP